MERKTEIKIMGNANGAVSLARNKQGAYIGWRSKEDLVSRKGCFYHGRCVVRSKYVTIVYGPWSRHPAGCNEEHEEEAVGEA